MSIETELASAIHGLPLNAGGVDVVCDLPHDIPVPVDTDCRRQYECVKLAASVTVYEGIRDEWYDT